MHILKMPVCLTPCQMTETGYLRHPVRATPSRRLSQ